MPADVIYHEGNVKLTSVESIELPISISDTHMPIEKKLETLQEFFESTMQKSSQRINFLHGTCISFKGKSTRLKLSALAFCAAIPAIAILSLFMNTSDFSSVAVSSSLALSFASALGLAATVILGVESMFGYQRKAEKAESDAMKLTHGYKVAQAGWLNTFLIDDSQKRLDAAVKVINDFNVGMTQGPYAELDSLKFIRKHLPSPRTGDD